MSLNPPSFKVIVELLSFSIQLCIGLLFLGLFLPVIIVKIIVEELFDYLNTVIEVLNQSSFIKRLKNKQ